MNHNDLAAKNSRSDILSAETAVKNSNEVHVDNKVKHYNNNIIQTLQPLSVIIR